MDSQKFLQQALLALMLVVLINGFVHAHVFPSKRMYGFKGVSKRSTQSSITSSLMEMNFEDVPFPQLSATINPFISTDDLYHAIKKDPFNLKYTQYSMGTSEFELKTNKRSLNRLVSNVDYAPIKHRFTKLDGNTMKFYSIQGKALSGIVNLDKEPNVWDVQCDSTDSSITIDFSDHSRTASRFVPGSKFIIGEKWNCFKGDEHADKVATANVVLTRQVITQNEGNMMRVRFGTRSISPAELFVEADISVQSRAITRNVRGWYNDMVEGAKKTGQAIGNAVEVATTYIPDPVLSGTRSAQVPRLRINCDSQGNPTNHNIQVYKSGALTINCEDCISYVDVEFSIFIKIRVTTLLNMRTTVGGDWYTHGYFRATVTSTFEKEIEKVLLKGPVQHVPLVISGIPVLTINLQPNLKFKGKVEAEGSISYLREFAVSTSKILGYEYNEGTYSIVNEGSGITFSTSNPEIEIETKTDLYLALIPGVDINVKVLGVIEMAQVYVGIAPRFHFELIGNGLIQEDSAKLYCNLNVYYNLMFYYESERLGGSKEFELTSETPIYDWSREFKTMTPSQSKYSPSVQNGDGSLNPGFFQNVADIIKSVPIPTVYQEFTSVPAFYEFNVKNANNNYFYIKYSTSANSNTFTSYVYSNSFTGQVTASITLPTKGGSVQYFKYEIYKNVLSVNSAQADQLIKTGVIDMSKTTSDGATVEDDTNAKIIYRLSQKTMFYFTTTPDPSIVKVIEKQEEIIVRYDGPKDTDFMFISVLTDKRLYSSDFTEQNQIDGWYSYIYKGPRGDRLVTAFAGTKVKFLQCLSAKSLGNTLTTIFDGSRTGSLGVPLIMFKDIQSAFTSYVVTMKAWGKFTLTLSEAWLQNSVFQMSNGVKYSSTDFTSSYTFPIDLQKNNVSASKLLVATIIPLDETFTIKEIAMTPFSLLTQDTYNDDGYNFYSGRLSINFNKFLYPYFMVSNRAGGGSMKFARNLWTNIHRDSDSYSVALESGTTTIPVPDRFLNETDISILSSRLDGVSIDLISNEQVYSGIPSLPRIITKTNRGYYAMNCSSVRMTDTQANTLYLRVFDGLTGSILPGNVIHVDIFDVSSDRKYFGSSLRFDSIADNSIFKTDISGACQGTSARYLQFVVSILEQTPVSLYLEASVVRTTTKTTLVLDPALYGHVFIDISAKIEAAKSADKLGVVLVSEKNSLSCLYEMNINTDIVLAPSSISDMESISAMGYNVGGTNSTIKRLPISFSKSGGTFIQFNLLNKCTLKIRFEDLSATTVDMLWINKATAGNTGLIVYNSNPDHVFDANAIDKINADPARIFDMLKSSNLDLKSIYVAKACSLFSLNQLLQINLVKADKSKIVKGDFTFTPDALLFSTLSTTKSSSALSVDESKQIIPGSNSNIANSSTNIMISLFIVVLTMLVNLLL